MIVVALLAVACIAIAAVVLSTRNSAGNAESDADTAGSPSGGTLSTEAQECLDLLADSTKALDTPAVSECRRNGHDPVWNAIGIYVNDIDYASWRSNGHLPTCDDLVGRPDPLATALTGESAFYDAVAVSDCKTQFSDDDPPGDGSDASTYDTLIEEAAALCGGGQVGDDGTSITFDTEGEDDFNGDSLVALACALTTLGVPDYVVQRVDQTRALDGTQDASWNHDGTDYGAFWNFHPSTGVNLTVFEQ